MASTNHCTDCEPGSRPAPAAARIHRLMAVPCRRRRAARRQAHTALIYDTAPGPSAAARPSDAAPSPSLRRGGRGGVGLRTQTSAGMYIHTTSDKTATGNRTPTQISPTRPHRSSSLPLCRLCRRIAVPCGTVCLSGAYQATTLISIAASRTLFTAWP